MYRYTQPKATSITTTDTYNFTGETIEEKVRRSLNNKEPIEDTAERIYTERKDGVLPEYDIRTDKWEIAVEGMGLISNTNIAAREARIKEMNDQLEKANKQTTNPGTTPAGGESGNPSQ